MPKLVKVAASDDYKPANAEAKAAYEAAKKAGVKSMPYVTAMENIKLSDGMFKIVAEEQALSVSVQSLEDKSNEELKVMLVSLGIKTEKQMRRPDIIRLIRSKLEDIEVIDE